MTTGNASKPWTPTLDSDLDHGLFARSHPLRPLIILNPDVPKRRPKLCQKTKPPGVKPEKSLVKHSNWAKLLKRIFYVDVSQCPICKAEMEIMSAILNSSEIERYLRHVGLWDI